MSDTPRAVDFATFEGRELVIDLAALRRIEKRLRRELEDPKLSIWAAARDFMLGALEGSVGLTELTIFLEEALRAKHPAVTDGEVLELLKPQAVGNRATSATLAVAAAIAAAFPEAKKGESAPASGASPLPGSTSGAVAAAPASPNGSSGG